MKNAILWNAILNGLTRVALVIGITYCAVYFRNAYILWWYMVPAFMSIEFSSTRSGDE